VGSCGAGLARGLFGAWSVMSLDRIVGIEFQDIPPRRHSPGTFSEMLFSLNAVKQTVMKREFHNICNFNLPKVNQMT
jgi:hypothetical protein